MDYKSEIVKKINEMAKYYSAHQVFRDWIEVYALSIANFCKPTGTPVWEKREQQYLSTIGKYQEQEILGFADLGGILALALEEDISDVLGAVYMGLETSSKVTGQFFTPDNISRLVSKMMDDEVVSTDMPIKLYEPACGSSGMIIAYAKALRDKDINYQRLLDIKASDIDFACVYMSYIQLSLLGIKAVIARQDSLLGEKVPHEHIFATPAKKGMLL
jgi:type I restriction-modification system methyltransferase subunit|nr:MAG TPA: N-6 DNA Methylase [Caudoviricetes sp.]